MRILSDIEGLGYETGGDKMAVRFPTRERKELLKKEIERILDVIKKRNIKKVILFGSLIDGHVTSKSDLDLVVIEETDKRFLDRLDELYLVIEPRLALDLLVYTPSEIEEMKTSNSFIRHILSKGRVIYEAE